MSSIIPRSVTAAFGTIGLAFGVNAILNPASALSFFELPMPEGDAERNLVEALMVVYGVRDIFMAVAIYAAAYFGSRRALGWITMSVGAVAFADGVVCKVYAGTGEWGHWGYAPVLTLMGAILAMRD